MSYLSTHLRSILTEVQILNEIGEGSAKPYPFKKQTETHYTFIARLGLNEKEEVRVDFEPLNHDKDLETKVLTNVFSHLKRNYNVGYKVGNDLNQFKKTEIGTFLRIVSTVSLIIQDFAKNTNPDLLYISGSPRWLGSDDNIKGRLYKVFIHKQLDKLQGYISQERYQGYIIFKPQKMNRK